MIFQRFAGIFQRSCAIFQPSRVIVQMSCGMFQCRYATFQPDAGMFQRPAVVFQQMRASFQPVGRRDLENSGDYRLAGRSRYGLDFLSHVLASRLRSNRQPSVRPEVAGIFANHRRSVNPICLP